MNGEPVVGSPLVVEVDAQEVSLPMCRLSGQGLAGAVAGERAVILIEARARREQPAFQGAAMGVAARVGGETSRETGGLRRRDVRGFVLRREAGPYG